MKKRESYIEGWKLYPASFVSHHVQGAIAAVGTAAFGVTGMVLAGLWTTCYVAYQGYTRLRKGDAAGLDVADYMVGLGIGTLGYAGWSII